MTWHDVDPPLRRPSQHAVTATATMGRGGMFPKLTIIVRPLLVDTPPLWLRAGARVRVQIGRDVNRGRLRILPLGLLTVATSPGRGAVGIAIRVPGLPGTSTHKQPTALEYDHNDDWFEVELPNWMPNGGPLDRTTIAAPSLVRSPAPAPERPFSMRGVAVAPTRKT